MKYWERLAFTASDRIYDEFNEYAKSGICKVGLCCDDCPAMTLCPVQNTNVSDKLFVEWLNEEADDKLFVKWLNEEADDN